MAVVGAMAVVSAQPPDPTQILAHGGENVDAGVGIVDPAHGNLVDGERVALTHYCSIGNQPHMETPAVSPSANEFAFGFVSATNLANADDIHMHQMTLKIEDADHFSEVWTMHMNGKEQTTTFHFTRKKV